MLIVLVGLTGALIYGAADFLGGLASRRVSAIRVTAVSGVAGLLFLLAVLPVMGGEWSTQAVLFGALSGLAGAGGLILLYGALAIGPMSILSPLTAVMSAIVPMTAGLIRGERLETLGYVALGLVLISVVLVGFVPDKEATRPTLRGLAYAIGSGTLIGTYLILIDFTPDESALVPLVVSRAANVVMMLAIVAGIALWHASRRRGAKPRGPLEPPQAGAPPATWRTGLGIAVLCGVLDALGNSLLLLGLRLGDLTVISVLSALYSVATISLAAIVLRERLTLSQVVGLVLALGAAALLAVV